jgi:hypothetical protein
MKTSRFPAILLISIVAVASVARAAPPALDLRSDKAAGLLTLNSDLVLNDGRLIIKLVAFNKSATAAELAPQWISVSTAAGKPVPLVSLEQLEDETRVALGAKPLHRSGDYAAVSTAQRPTVVDSSGQLDVSGYTGGQSAASTITPARREKVDESANPQLKAALENLRAAILQPISVAPNTAGGGNIVTQPIKFGRKDARSLRVTVGFAGEQHEFEFIVPKDAQ